MTLRYIKVWAAFWLLFCRLHVVCTYGETNDSNKTFANVATSPGAFGIDKYGNLHFNASSLQKRIFFNGKDITKILDANEKLVSLESVLHIIQDESLPELDTKMALIQSLLSPFEYVPKAESETSEDELLVRGRLIVNDTDIGAAIHRIERRLDKSAQSSSAVPIGPCQADANNSSFPLAILPIQFDGAEGVVLETTGASSVALSSSNELLLKDSKVYNITLLAQNNGSLEDSLATDLGETLFEASFSADCRYVYGIASSSYGDVLIYEVASGEKLRTIPDSATSVVMTPDNTKVVTYSNTPQRARVWDVETLDPLAFGAAGSSSYDATVAITGNRGFSGDGYYMRIFSLTTGVDEIGYRYTTRSSDHATAAAFVNTTHILIGTKGGSITLYDVTSSWSLVKHLSRYHTNRVIKIKFTPDKRYFASAGLDGKVKIWNSTTFELHTNILDHVDAGTMRSMDVTDSYLAISTSAETTLRILPE